MNKEITHVASPENQKPATPLEIVKQTLNSDYMKQVTNYYGGNKEEALRFMTAAIEYVRRVPKLLECERTSLMMALVQVAQFQFLPSGVSGEAYIIPYSGVAKFQMGYQGIVTLLYRTNRVVAITANIIYEKDEFDYQEGLDAHLIHKPAMFGKTKGEAVGVYAVAQMKGGTKIFKVMDKDAVMAIKNLSKAKTSADSPWNSAKDPELWMWKKTCLIQLAKLLPKSAELQQAIEKDFDGEGMEKHTLDAGGPAVGAALHEPIQMPTVEDPKGHPGITSSKQTEKAGQQVAVIPSAEDLKKVEDSRS